MKLSEVLKGVEDVSIRGSMEIDVPEITYDSRKVNDGDMFVAIIGFKTDGHSFIESAIQNGAKIIVMQEGSFDVGMIPEGITVVVSKDTRTLLPKIACNFFNNPTREFKVIGVTGTKGKTTTTYMIKSILEQAGKKVGLIGTIANYLGDRCEEAQRTTPESLDLQRMFREMADNKVDVAVMEVSSHSLALDRVWGVDFDLGIYTNLTQDHMDFHKTFDNYLEAKAKLFTMCKKVILNADDYNVIKVKIIC